MRLANKRVKIFVIVLVISKISLSQTLNNINITDFSNTEHWTYLGVTDSFDTYYRSNVRYFDRIVLFRHDSKSFFIENPSVEIFDEVYEYIKEEFGKEDINVDFIRYGTDVNNNEKFHNAIKEGNAIISRIWIVDKIKICLDWYYDNEEGKDRITILSYYKDYY